MDNPFSILSSFNFNHPFLDNLSISTSITTTQSSQEWGDIDSFCTEYGFNQAVIPNYQQQLLQRTFFQDSSNPLTDPQRTFKNVINEFSQKLSTEQILKLAGERFVNFSSQESTSFHPYCASTLSDLPIEDKQDVELAQLLLAAAEKVESKQFDRANTLLQNCLWISSHTGTPVQRVVFYFSEALTNRIKNEKQTCSEEKHENIDACLINRHTIIPAALAMHQQLPFYQVIHLTAVQTILENVNNKPKVHLIDFQILTGLHWAPFMQAVSEQTRAQHGYLKITAIETVDRVGVENTGRLLQSFANHLNLPFFYNVVFLSDIKDLRQEDFGIEPEEAVAFLYHFTLRMSISKPNWLKNLMTITRRITPSIAIVCEVEANHNSPSFVSRFIEALFYYGALFDSLEESMGGSSKSRVEIESGMYREGIRNIVATEGYERSTRSVSISVWRAFFARFGMQEMELSAAAIYQASLIVDQFSCGKSCTLDVTSKCLLVGWKGTPLFSLSAWKFS